jgi:hypothetical protein
MATILMATRSMLFKYMQICHLELNLLEILSATIISVLNSQAARAVMSHPPD